MYGKVMVETKMGESTIIWSFHVAQLVKTGGSNLPQKIERYLRKREINSGTFFAQAQDDCIPLRDGNWIVLKQFKTKTAGKILLWQKF
jgi:hypothetical protein